MKRWLIRCIAFLIGFSWAMQALDKPIVKLYHWWAEHKPRFRRTIGEIDEKYLLPPPLEWRVTECQAYVNCAEARMKHFEEHKRIEDLNMAIVMFRQAACIQTSWSTFFDISVLHKYTHALLMRNEILQQIDDADEAIAALRTSLGFVPSEHRGRTLLLFHLGLCLCLRLRHKPNTKDAAEAVASLRQVLESPLPASSDIKKAALKNWSAVCSKKLRQLAHRDDLDWAIRYLRSAKAKASLDDIYRVFALLELGLALLWHALRVPYNASDVDEAVLCIEEVLQYNPSPLAYLLSQLADAHEVHYYMRFQPEDLEKAIGYRRQVVSQLTGGKDTEEYHDAIVRLVKILELRIATTGFLSDIEQVVNICQDALRIAPEGSSRQRTLCSLLLHAHSRWCWTTGDHQSHQQAVELYEFLVQSTDDVSERAALYTIGFKLLNKEDIIDKAISCYEQLQSDRHRHLLADCLLWRYGHGGDADDLSRCLSLCEGLLVGYGDHNVARHYCLLASALYMRSRIPGTQNPDEDCERAMTLFKHGAEETTSSLPDRLSCVVAWAYGARECSHPSAMAGYRTALSLLEVWVLISSTLQLQQELLSANVTRKHRSLALNAASHALGVGDIPLAVEILEQGRGLLWSQIRGLRTPHESLSGVDEELRQQFLSVARKMERLITSTSATTLPSCPPLRDDTIAAATGIYALPSHIDQVFFERQRLAKELEGAIDNIRKLPGHESFLRAKPFAELKNAAIEGPVVIINLSDYRSDAIIVFYEREPVAIQLPDADEFLELEGKLSFTREEYGPGSRQFNKALLETMRDLWNLVVERVVDKLRECGVQDHSRIWWCPTSVATALPLHAAATIIDKRYVYLPDMFVSSYTPTLTALIEARRSASEPLPRPSPSASFLLVAQPDETLLHVGEEVGVIQKAAPSDFSMTCLISSDGTHEMVQEKIRTHRWVHFACHGRLAPRDPFISSFQLYNDARLTLLDIAKANIPNAELAFLSACHSAEQVRGSYHEEALHLATAMQIGGFKSVIGTMWAVEDEDGPFVAKEFYSRMFAVGGSGAEIGYKKSARALCEATRTMREDKRYRHKFERWVNFVHIGA